MYYDSGKFADAAHEFEEAHKISKHAALLYNIYLAYRDINRLQPASDALRAYLDAVPGDPRASQLRARLLAMEETLRTQDEGAAVPSSGEPAKGEASTAAEPNAEHSAPGETTKEAPAGATKADASEPSQVLPLIFLGLGGTMLIGAGVTQVFASSTSAEAEKLCPGRDCTQASPEDDKRNKELTDTGKTLLTVNYILLAGGIVTLGVGAGLYLFGELAAGDEDSPPAAASVALGCSAQGCSATWSDVF